MVSNFFQSCVSSLEKIANTNLNFLPGKKLRIMNKTVRF